MTATLEQRLARLEAIEAIERLKHVYWHYNDTGLRGDKIAELFTEDGVWSNQEFGNHSGRAAIRQFFDATASTISFCSHLGMNPIIDVTGDAAVGRWRGILLYTMASEAGPTPMITLMDYVDEFLRVDGTWYLRRMDILFNFSCPFHGSWVGLEKVRAST